jgi:hypothetical protein
VALSDLTRGLWGWSAGVMPSGRFPAVRDTDPAIIPSLDDTDPIHWRPLAFPWPGPSADQWSVAIDDVVAVSLDGPEGLSGSDGDPLIDRIVGAMTIRAVPGVLPVGYTENRYEEWPNAIGTLPSGAPRPSIDITTHRRTATGLEDVGLWVPSADWNGYTGAISGSPITTVHSFYDQNGATIGFRKVQIKVSCGTALAPGTPLTAANFDGTLQVTLSHNADGTYAAAPGDTTDFDQTFTRADFTVVAGPLVETAWIDCGAIQGTLGVPTYWLSRFIGALTVNPGVGLWGASVRLSPRLDVPLPSLVTGVGNLFAPGGYVP